ncbi:hypothetical protein GCM10010201_35720 [Pilimelia columellifera subsp. columellifera]|uniref:Immunity protein 40 domain-containing protein n=1 Tax=Pilimelia columellifera subsp. columellifera TaxID=706583 RepID=A0ABP6B231_9ACTN
MGHDHHHDPPPRPPPTHLKPLFTRLLVVLGGDLWEHEDGKYYPSGESWYVDSREGESPRDREARVRVAAIEFFELYIGADDKGVTFVVKSGASVPN